MSVEIDIDLPLGENTIEWKEATGYADLKVKINITEVALLCVSMNDGACRGVSPYPFITISDFTVKGWLKAVAVGIGNWIDESGVTNLTLDHALYVFYLSEGWTSLADKKYTILSPKPSRIDTALATLDNALGAYYYSEGWNSLGNKKTGCSY